MKDKMPYLINPITKKDKIKHNLFDKEDITMKRRRRVKNPLEEGIMLINPRRKHRKHAKRHVKRHYKRHHRRHHRKYKKLFALYAKPLKNPIRRSSGRGGFINIELLKDVGLVFVGYSLANYGFNLLGNKVSVMSNPIPKAVGKLAVALAIDKFGKSPILKVIAVGFGVSAVKDIITIVAPQVAGMLSASEMGSYLPETELKDFLPESSEVSGYLPDASNEVASLDTLNAEVEEF